MGLLDKMLGNIVNAGINGIKEALGKETDNDKPAGSVQTSEQAGADTVHNEGDSFVRRMAPWGDEMPDEENQYNYNGSYTEYFENIFKTEFAAYRTEKSGPGDRRTAYTFYDGASAKVLVVELMPESSSANRLRRDCEKEGVPYLRFYYDHNGWWNTRAYVTGRISTAVKK